MREADAEQLPIAAEEIDVAMVNGIFNLNPSERHFPRACTRAFQARWNGLCRGTDSLSPLPPEARASETIGLRELPVRRKELPSCTRLGKQDSLTLSFSGRAVTPELSPHVSRRKFVR